MVIHKQSKVLNWTVCNKRIDGKDKILVTTDNLKITCKICIKRLLNASK